jgi:hypothetical protein
VGPGDTVRDAFSMEKAFHAVRIDRGQVDDAGRIRLNSKVRSGIMLAFDALETMNGRKLPDLGLLAGRLTGHGFDTEPRGPGSR